MSSVVSVKNFFRGGGARLFEHDACISTRYVARMPYPLVYTNTTVLVKTFDHLAWRLP